MDCARSIPAKVVWSLAGDCSGPGAQGARIYFSTTQMLRKKTGLP